VTSFDWYTLRNLLRGHSPPQLEFAKLDLQRVQKKDVAKGEIAWWQGGSSQRRVMVHISAGTKDRGAQCGTTVVGKWSALLCLRLD